MSVSPATNIARDISAANRAAATRQAVIDALKRRKIHGASARFISADSGRTKSTVNRALAVLIDGGIVERIRNPYDARTPMYRLK